VLRPHANGIYSIAAAPDGRLVVGKSDGVVLVLSSVTGAVEATLLGHFGIVRALCPLTDDTNWLLSSNEDHEQATHEQATHEQATHEQATHEQATHNHSIVLLHDLDAAHGGAEVPPTHEYRGHSSYVSAIVELTGGRFASASSDQTIRIWATESGACLATLRGHTSYVGALAVADDDTLVSGGEGKTLRV